MFFAGSCGIVHISSDDSTRKTAVRQTAGRHSGQRRSTAVLYLISLTRSRQCLIGFSETGEGHYCTYAVIVDESNEKA